MPHPSESWPDVSREHLPVVEAELNIGKVIEIIAKNDLEQGTRDGLKNFVDWANDSLHKGFPVVNETDIVEVNGGDLEHTITKIRGYAYSRKERIGTTEKFTTVSSDAKTNLTHSLQRLLGYVKQFSPEGLDENVLKTKFSDRLEKALEDFTSPKVKRLI